MASQHDGAPIAQYIFDPRDISKAALGTWFEADFALDDKDVQALDGEGLIFETKPFASTTEIIGRPEFEAYIGINTPDTDFQLRVYEVLADGSSVYLAESRARARYRVSAREEILLTSDKPQLYTFKDWSFASRRLAPGSRLRFVFNAPNSIYIQRNYQAAKPVADQVPADAQTATVRMVLGGNKGAKLTLPLRTVTP